MTVNGPGDMLPMEINHVILRLFLVASETTLFAIHYMPDDITQIELSFLFFLSISRTYAISVSSLYINTHVHVYMYMYMYSTCSSLLHVYKPCFNRQQMVAHGTLPHDYVPKTDKVYNITPVPHVL